jgi:CubicO group peptidase (beta-lactamase class C family)
MSSGLAWLEDYVDAQQSDVIEMLFGLGKDDVAGFAAQAKLSHPPDTVWCYSSGTSNLVASIAGRAIGDGEPGYREFLRRELFARIGMASASARFDPAGTWIGSSFVFATARDYARFGLLYLRDGVWEGERVLPERWVEHARTLTPGSAGEYGALVAAAGRRGCSRRTATAGSTCSSRPARRGRGAARRLDRRAAAARQSLARRAGRALPEARLSATTTATERPVPAAPAGPARPDPSPRAPSPPTS